MKLSVVTVTFNNEKTIGEYLASVLKRLPKDSEIVVVDSGSTDSTPDILNKERRINFIRSEKNIGFGAGNNLGVKEASGEYLFFLNPDATVLDDSLNELVKFADGNQGWGIIAPKLLEEDKVQPSVRKLPTISGVIKEYFFGQKNEYEPYSPVGDKPREVESAVGAALFIKKGIFEKVGGFDKRYFMYFEDLELCRQVRKLGLKVIYFPGAQFTHKVGASINDKKLGWIKDSERIYHGSFKFAFLSLLYFLVRIKNFVQE